MYIGKNLSLIEQHWAHFLFLSIPLFSASTQKYEFSMNYPPPFFCFDFLIYILDVNQICIRTTCSCTFTLKFYLQAFMYFIWILTLLCVFYGFEKLYAHYSGVFIDCASSPLRFKWIHLYTVRKKNWTEKEGAIIKYVDIVTEENIF